MTPELEAKILALLVGIDLSENEHPSGWWETSVGAEFGEQKLKALLELLRSEL